MTAAQDEPARGNPAGLPRPRRDGLPVPWITQVSEEGPEWRRVERSRVIACQTGWLCQGCGQPLPRRAWVVLNDDRDVISNAPLCLVCLTMALRWCPALAEADDIETIEVTPDDLHPDGEPASERCSTHVMQWSVP